MKKLTAISFLCIFLFANTELGQLLKLPVLVHHFLEHHDDAGMAFITFLNEHYNEEKSHPSANNEHEKLPFKSHDLGFLQTTLANQPPAEFEFKVYKPISIKENIIYSITFHSSSALASIWQPPKIC